MKRNIVLLFAASLFVLLLFSCSTDVSGADGSVLEQKEVAVLRTLTDTEMAALLDKELLSPAEIAAIDATAAAQSDSRTFDILAWIQPIERGYNVYDIILWYALNETFDSISSNLTVYEIENNGHYRRITSFTKYRNNAPAGSNWDAAARYLDIRKGRGYAIGVITGVDNGRTKIVVPKRWF